MSKECFYCMSHSMDSCSACSSEEEREKFRPLTKETLVLMVKDYEKAILELQAARIATP